MKALKFTLSGKTAFFKKPEVNTFYYFTYGQIHKVVLLGIFGALLGYKGHIQKKWVKPKKGQTPIVEYPEFYEKLNHLSVSIVPRNNKGYISKKVQCFNNSTGFASEEKGGNLIVKEQWLENPIWDIYVLLDCEEAEKITDSIINKKCVYIPYFGKNDHIADISDAQIVDIRAVHCNDTTLSCLFPKAAATIGLLDEDEEAKAFKYEESLPVRLNGYTNLYECEKFCFTNLPVEIKEKVAYEVGNRKLIFY